MLTNLRENFLYGKIPEGVLDQDIRGVLQAVIGGYQDRICDLRFFTDRVSTLSDPTQTPPASNTSESYLETFVYASGTLTLERYAHDITSLTVNGVQWAETDALGFCGAENVFEVSVSAAGKSVIAFGNGTHGNTVALAATVRVSYLVRAGVTVEIQYSGDQGQLVTRVLDINATTPPFYAEDALRRWASSESGVDEDQIESVTVGTDVLRQISANTLAMLAATVGANIYRNPTLTETEQVEQSRRQLLAWFPRLRIKGTITSFSVLGRLLGFDSSVLLPLWQRLSPRLPHMLGCPENDADFALQPEMFPVPVLPDPAGFYDPLAVADGPFFTWLSPPLRTDPAHPDYYEKAIATSPFVRPVRLTTDIIDPPARDYYLGAGSVDRKASVDLNSTLRLEAITASPAMNGLRVQVSQTAGYGTYPTGQIYVQGTYPQMRIQGRLSKIKYRSSYYDLALCADADRFDARYGTPPVSINDASYEIRSELSGTCPSTGRPLTGGYTSAYYGVSALARSSAEPMTQQVRDELLRSLGRKAVEASEEIRPASRVLRRAYYGFLLEDDVNYAPVNSRQLIANMAGFTVSGTVSTGSVPLPVPAIGAGALKYSGTILQYGTLAHFGSYTLPATTYGYSANFYVEQRFTSFTKTKVGVAQFSVPAPTNSVTFAHVTGSPDVNIGDTVMIAGVRYTVSNTIYLGFPPPPGTNYFMRLTLVQNFAGSLDGNDVFFIVDAPIGVNLSPYDRMERMEIERVAGSPILHLSAGTITGSYNLANRQYAFFSTKANAGSIVAYWNEGSTEVIRPEPSVTALLPYGGALYGSYGSYTAQLVRFDWGSYSGRSILAQITANGTIKYVPLEGATGNVTSLDYLTNAPNGCLINALLVRKWGLQPSDLAYYQDRPEDQLSLEEGTPVSQYSTFVNPYGAVFGSYNAQEPWLLSWLGLSGSFTSI